MDEYDLSFSFPAMSNFTGFESEWKQLSNSYLNPAMGWLKNRDFAIGLQLAEEGLTAKHPVVLIPGCVILGH